MDLHRTSNVAPQLSKSLNGTGRTDFESSRRSTTPGAVIVAAAEVPASRRGFAARTTEPRPASSAPSAQPSTSSSYHKKLKDIMDALRRPVPEEVLKQRREPDGTVLTYIPWHSANRILDHYAPGWHGEVRSVTFGPHTVTVVYRITILGADGDSISREATGTEQLPTASSAGGPDPVQMAEQMAFRRAAARFGLGLDLYGSAI
ncbi:RAD52 [Klebsormidium nitens]|uniref:RAD52 n=1 Tax=Klebsormidium nitens TaxID=105231 RepID=A0A1Y1HWD4_KLENI|nr:RAD52 [Klebsormidium nitens]|eukprot:GAQ82945.1 RAD52 [Klebsormidium nitens]